MTPPEFVRPAERADDLNTDVNYDVDAAKREAKRARRGKVKALRQEGLTDEDGEAVVQGLDSNLSRRLLRYLRPYRRTTAGAIALLLAGLAWACWRLDRVLRATDRGSTSP